MCVLMELLKTTKYTFKKIESHLSTYLKQLSLLFFT